MTAAGAPLASLLAHGQAATPNLDAMSVDEMRGAARFWFGTTASNKMRRDDLVGALKDVFRDRRRLHEGLQSLPDKQRQILALFRRYGGALSGALLKGEALARGLIDKTEHRPSFYGQRHPDDPVLDLWAKLLLLSRHGGGYSQYHSYSFHADFWTATGQEGSGVSWHDYSWRPHFAAARDKDPLTPGEQSRRLAYWLDSTGAWAANALLGTLAHLGLVEHGVATSHGKSRPCFRLTGLGVGVFGAPERSGTEPAYEDKFLTVQPNHEVLAYLDHADPRAVGPLAQMARRVSAPGERVQTFALSRDSVYLALESGLTAEAIRDFLTRHGKSGLPDLVAHSLAEWGRKREALVFRSGITLGAAPPGAAHPFADLPKARPVGDSLVLLPATAARGRKDSLVRDHDDFARPVWQVDEDGRVAVSDAADSVCRARLAQFADPDGGDWVITAASVARARDRGIPVEQVLGWLDDHLGHELPPLLRTAIDNWSSPAGVFLGELLMLQVKQAEAYEAIRASPRFEPLLLGAVPPHWLIARPERRAELERLLTELGFAPGASWKPSAADRGKAPDNSPGDDPRPKRRKRRRAEDQP